MIKLTFKFKVFLILLLGGLLTSFFVFSEDLEKVCEISRVDSECEHLSPNECQNLLNRCLEYYQAKGEGYEEKVAETSQKRKTLQSEINYLSSRIKKLNNEIYQSNILIKDLNIQIKDTETSIVTTTDKIEETRLKLEEILRVMYIVDNKSIVEILLEEDNLSGFFDELAALESLNYQHQELLTDIRGLKIRLEDEKDSLGDEKDSLERTVLISSLKAQENTVVKEKKNILLQETKGEEKRYQEYLEEVNEKASEIRRRIFELAQVSETEAPSYEEAYTLAKNAGDLTGVRPALILGLLTVESAIGKNVGQCNCPGKAFCRHPDIHYQEVMTKGQWDSFLKITSELGLDPNTTPVSCSVNGGKVQWGGAMGPAQFMPNTWLKLGYKERIEKITGIKPANPWRVRDAFIAAGLYLADWGADTQILSKEIGAVTAYLCGTSRMTTTCSRAGGKSYRYSVMQKTNQWQEWIDDGVFNK